VGDVTTARAAQRWAMELVVLVVGILAAFGLDAWWDAQKDAAREQELLTELLSELAEARVTVNSTASVHEVAAAQLDDLLTHLRTVALDDRVQVPDTLLSRLAAFNTLEISSGVLQSATASGELSLIRNRELRARLLEWPTVLAEVVEQEVLGRDFSFEELVVAMPRDDVSEVIALPLGTLRESIAESGSRSYSVSSTARLRNVTAARLRIELGALSDYADLQSQLDALIALFEQELAR
jgi:hypothetical protein